MTHLADIDKSVLSPPCDEGPERTHSSVIACFSSIPTAATSYLAQMASLSDRNIDVVPNLHPFASEWRLSREETVP